MPICTRCGSRNVEGARFCGNCGAQVSAVEIPNPPVWMSTPPPPMFPKPGISRAVWRFIGWGSAIAVGIFILLVIIGTLLPSAPNQSDASQTSQPLAVHGTVNNSAPTPEEAEKAKRLKLGIEAMTQTWQGTPTAFNERENLRFDAVIVMPDDTVCLWIHDAHPVPPGVEETNALFTVHGTIPPTPGVEEPNALAPSGQVLLAMNDVTFYQWKRECTNQQGGINVLPELENNANQLQQKMNDLNQQLHDAKQ